MLRETLRLVPDDGDLDTFAERVAETRGRPISLLPWPLTADAPSGLWITQDDHDVIVYPATAPKPRRAAIVCHELAHMLLGHDDGAEDHPGDGAELAALLTAPDIDPDVAKRFLTRHGYTDSVEAEAERLGTQLAIALNAAAAAPSDRVARRLR